MEQFTALAAQVPSRFFTMDVARRKGGDWLVVELGDGQVAGMPEQGDVDRLSGGLATGLDRGQLHAHGCPESSPKGGG